MSHTAKLSTALATIALVTMALAGCTATAAPTSADQTPRASTAAAATDTEPTPKATPKDTPTPTPTPTPTATGCPTAKISFPTPDSAELVGDITDTGVREYAVGQPTLNADGQIISYTVQAGDALEAIAARFCIDANSFGTYNKVTYWAMQPGDVLVLRPDPEAAWAPQTLDEAAAVSCKAGYKNGIDMSDSPGRVKGWIADFGARAGANGTVSRNADDEIESYTVAAGDNLTAVADRFCFDTESLAAYNETGPNLTVGDVLVLRPPFED
ncbi:LysM peptidoglycan-binding domain-containing protein [Microbacterium sp. NPDC096154]|uniref:LysM peptidoglycan-binding domain-containing protein n=1 Tax=Microbacterium sp. NPDC096154 TaxID=3155549 RepID=UPI00331F6D49